MLRLSECSRSRTQQLNERRSEDTIRTRLREIIEQSRRVRAELSEMIGDEGQSSRFLHRASWPTQPALPNAEISTAGEETESAGKAALALAARLSHS